MKSFKQHIKPIELGEAKDHRVELEKRHIKALTIIRYIDQTLGKQGKWTDSFGNYVTAKMPDDVDTSVDEGWAYHQARGRGDWNFIIGPKDMVKYNNSKMPWNPKSGVLPYKKFMELLKTVAKETKFRNESVELDENRLSDLHMLSQQGLNVEKVNAILQLSKLLNIDWRRVKDITNESFEQ